MLRDTITTVVFMGASRNFCEGRGQAKKTQRGEKRLTHGKKKAWLHKEKTAIRRKGPPSHTEKMPP